jgi:xylan 1,4-beta-xylosidase
MMKHTLDLAEELDIELRGVLTWAFTFPGSPYFAGYRALSSNGIHLPVLNAFKLLGKLEGERLPVTSDGALPLADIVSNGVRGQPDVDALAAIDGDRVRILVWNYHDDLVAASPSAVTLEVAVPQAFEAHAVATHTRVDEHHGDAYTVWLSQGSPEDPSEVEIAELRAAMQPAVLEQRSLPVVRGRVSLSFELPRFGLSLVTLEPPDGSARDAHPVSDAGCACRLPRAKRTRLPLLFALALAGAVACRRRRSPTASARRLAP